jgi:hypothetical protein
MIEYIFLAFGAALLVDVDSLNAFFDIFTPFYAICIVAIIVYLKGFPGEETQAAVK